MGCHFILCPYSRTWWFYCVLPLLINTLILRRHYPFNLSLPGKDASHGSERPPVKLRFSEEDLTAALREMNGYIDVTGEDLEKIYSLAIRHSHQRRMGDIRLKNIMTREVVTVKSDQSLEEIWKLLRSHHIRGLPVIDEAKKLVGMLSIADFLKVADWRMCNTLVARLDLLSSLYGDMATLSHG
jgi:CBS domain-containing membrane protein